MTVDAEPRRTNERREMLGDCFRVEEEPAHEPNLIGKLALQQLVLVHECGESRLAALDPLHEHRAEGADDRGGDHEQQARRHV